MILAAPLRRIESEASVVEALLSRLRAATERAIEAVRCADSAALEAALEARGALLLQSGAAIEALSLTRAALEPSQPEAVRARLEGTMRVASQLGELESSLHVGLSAVHQQARLELRALDQLTAQTSRYRLASQPHGKAIDMKG